VFARVRGSGWLAAGFVVSTALLAPAAAEAQHSVTIAARSCPTYESITANLARNDIQESLKNLGPNTLYRPGQLIDPQLETAGQPLCVPLPNWRFRFGRDYQTKAVSGPWGSLSRVTGEFPTEIVTRESIPLRNASGAPTGRSIEGAVTIELTQAQFDAAGQHDLWLQGGTPADPVLDQLYPGQYGFGALRCAVDNYNGDNVEYIAYPLGAVHVFCYAYYVTPPPTSGTIVVRKEVDAPGGVAAHEFRFQGNLSYNPGGAFSLSAAPGRPASTTFYRAGATAWTVREVSEPGWALLDHGCTSQTGQSTVLIPALSSELEVRLAANDTVTCTFRNGIAPPLSGLTVGKVTLGATGETAFRIRGDVGVADVTVPTSEPGVPEYATLPLPGSEYRVTETPSEMSGGRWERRQVRCGGRILEPFSDPLVITPPPGAGVVCVWTNEFIPAGSIRVRKVMTGSTGSTSFTIRPIDADQPVLYQQRAVASREGVAVTAEGDATDQLPLGTYDIQETTPGGTGSWRLESVTCNGVPLGSAQGRIRVRLTADQPGMTCTFIDHHSRATPGGGRDEDTPGGGGGRDASDPSPHTNLRVTKRVRPTSIVSGQPVRYTVVVRNTGRVTARDVVIAELRPPSHRTVDIDVPRGVRCRGTRPLRCVIGTLRPGRRITFGATYTTALTGRVVNRVAVHTSTAETRLGDNRGRAALQVAPPRPVACTSRATC
jgi:uncharacterized repeat protein (TIGR01451 family)